MNVQQQPSGFYVHMNGQIESCKICGSSQLYVKYSYNAGRDWTLLHGIDHGISQISSTSSAVTSDADLYVWNYPLECIYRSSNISGWPQLIVCVYGLTALGADIVRGYGWIHLPITPGTHTRYIPLFTPISSSWLQRFTSWLTNNPPEYFDSRFVAQTMGREVTRTQSQGAVKVTFQVTTKNMQTFGYQRIGEMKNIQSTNILYGSQLMTGATDTTDMKKLEKQSSGSDNNNNKISMTTNNLRHTMMKDYPPLQRAPSPLAGFNTSNLPTSSSTSLFSPASPSPFNDKLNDNLADYRNTDIMTANNKPAISSSKLSARSSLRNSVNNAKSSPSNKTQEALLDNRINRSDTEMISPSSWHHPSAFPAQPVATDNIQSFNSFNGNPAAAAASDLGITPTTNSFMGGNNISMESYPVEIVDSEDLMAPNKISARRRSNLLAEAVDTNERGEMNNKREEKEEEKEQIIGDRSWDNSHAAKPNPSRTTSQRGSLRKHLPLLPTVLATKSATSSLYPSRRGTGNNSQEQKERNNNGATTATEADDVMQLTETAAPSSSQSLLAPSYTLPERSSSAQSSNDESNETIAKKNEEEFAEVETPVNYTSNESLSSTLPFTTHTLSASPLATAATPSPLPLSSSTITLAPITGRAKNRLQPMKLSVGPRQNVT